MGERTSPTGSPRKTRPRTSTRTSRSRFGRSPDHQRVPLVLFHFEGRSYQEIASVLRVSLGKVKTDMHRGRKALKDRLEGGDAR